MLANLKSYSLQTFIFNKFSQIFELFLKQGGNYCLFEFSKSKHKILAVTYLLPQCDLSLLVFTIIKKLLISRSAVNLSIDFHPRLGIYRKVDSKVKKLFYFIWYSSTFSEIAFEHFCKEMGLLELKLGETDRVGANLQ